MISPGTRNRIKFFLAGPLFEAGNPWIPGHPHERLADLAARGNPERVLEICGGTGYAARLLAHRVPEAEIHSLDISAEMIAYGRRRLARHGVRNLTLHIGDAADLPFADRSFDVVMSVFGLHELPTDVRRKSLAEIVRVLRPGGRLTVVDLDTPPTAQRAFHAYLRLTERPHAREVLGAGLADQLTAAGLTITEHHPTPGWHTPFQTIEARASR